MEEAISAVELEFGVLVFVEGVKPHNPEKNKARNNNKLNPHMTLSRATLVGDERSHHCAIPAPQAHRS